MEIHYPTLEKIIEYNLLILEFVKLKNADQSKVLSINKILEVIQECKEKEGDIYDKAVILLRGLIRKHPFASGNRRTAFVITKDFILSNNYKFIIEDDPNLAKIMQGIREHYYLDEEIKEWLKNGKIRKFER